LRTVLTTFGILLSIQFVHAKDTVQWSEHMRSMQENLKEIFPVTYPKSDTEKVNLKNVEKAVKRQAETAAKLQKENSISNDKDPSLKLIAHLFSKETDRAYRETKKGNWTYGRTVLKSTTSYCIACHTRNSWGPNTQGTGGPEPGFFKNVSLMGKGTYYAATRQFDRALEEFERVISDRNFQRTHSLDWERAVRQSLAIAVRVKQDPAKAISITERVLGNQEAPFYLRQEAEKWKKSLSDWQTETLRAPQTEEGLFAEAKRLINSAKTLQEFTADRSADMVYLRASSTLHTQLMKFPAGKFVAEAYYLLGYTYEVLRDLDIWNLHELYYASCVHQNPHSDLAKNCYRSYENSIYSGYSGSGGTFLPDDVKADLKELQKLALPQGAL
jgi:tetratricopeptide (TPR) repeat protein